MRTRIVVLAACAAAAVGLAACGSSSGSSGSTGGKNSPSSTSKPKNFQVQTPAGQVSLSLDGKLPPGWPSSFPVPKGAEVAGSGSLVGDSKDVMIAVYTTSDSGENAYSFYTGQSALNPSDQKKVGVGSAFLGSMKISGTDTGSVTIAAEQNNTYIVIVLEPTTTASSTT